MKKILAALVLFLALTSAAGAEMPSSRIISTMPNITEILFALGLDREIAAVTDFCNYPPAAEGREKIGGLLLNWEKIVALQPDLIIFLDGARPQEAARAERLKLTVLTVRMGSAAELLEGIKKIGWAAKRMKEADALAGQIRSQIELFERQSGKIKSEKKARAYVGLGGQPLVTAGPGTFINELIGLAGGINIAAGLKGQYPQVSWEFLLKEQPDIIVIPQDIQGSEGDLDHRPMAGQLKAVQNGQVLIINGDIFTRPGPRSVEAVKQLSERFYLTKLDPGK